MSYCTICEYDGEFRDFRNTQGEVQAGKMCPRCNSKPRHRLMWYFLKFKTDLFSGKPLTVLHFAPEKCFASRFAALPDCEYISADLEPGKADRVMDITDIPLDSESVGAVIASHVMEHIADDRKALSEIFRVLKPGGWACLMTPLHDAPTHEDWTITTPEGRNAAFGQWDHVRVCGTDYTDRLKDAGFSARCYMRKHILPPELRKQTRVGDRGLFYGAKP